jgi:hypothetical protein
MRWFSRANRTGATELEGALRSALRPIATSSPSPEGTARGRALLSSQLPLGGTTKRRPTAVRRGGMLVAVGVGALGAASVAGALTGQDQLSMPLRGAHRLVVVLQQGDGEGTSAGEGVLQRDPPTPAAQRESRQQEPAPSRVPAGTAGAATVVRQTETRPVTTRELHPATATARPPATAARPTEDGGARPVESSPTGVATREPAPVEARPTEHPRPVEPTPTVADAGRRQGDELFPEQERGR